MAINDSPVWQRLQADQKEICSTHLSDLFTHDPLRFNHFSLVNGPILFDYSKNKITQKIIHHLCELACTQTLPEKIQALFLGQVMNVSEQRPALHTSLRMPATASLTINNADIMLQIHHALERLENFVNKIHSGQWSGWAGDAITDIVNIGMGGSYAGSKMACHALDDYAQTALRFHFLNTIDPQAITALLQSINPATTLFIVASKSFTTHETMLNAKTIRDWLTQQSNNRAAFLQHMVAVTANFEEAVDFGFAEENIFPLWDWVGGRFSIWSAMALPLMLKIGMPHFREFLTGAYEMDHHFLSAPLTENMPALLGLIGIWNSNFLALGDHLVIPYGEALAGLPEYLQQLEMESNGKQMTNHDEQIDYLTAPMVWGAAGCNAQHSFHQLLHQGTRHFSVDFLFSAKGSTEVEQHQEWLMANCLGQSLALMNGNQAAFLPAHQNIPGDHASNTLLLDAITPASLGYLLALYEHKVFVQAIIWDINPFDQWGVELGKTLSHRLFPYIAQGQTDLPDNLDASTKGLISHIRQLRNLTIP